MMVAKRVRSNENRNYFKVVLDGVEIPGFQRISQLETGIELDFDESKNEVIPGDPICNNVILYKKRTREQPFWNWLREIQEGNLEKKSLLIELIYRNKPLRGWKLINCWPCRWAISDITDDVIDTMEEIELVVERIELI
jgi:phage tail-like protein